MKRTVLVLVTIILAVSAFLGGCGGTSSSGKEKVTINVLNWGDYIEDSLISKFEEMNDWIDVNYTTVASNEEMYTIVTTEGSDFDLIFPSDYMVERLAKENMLNEINYDNIPNAKYLNDFNLKQSYDPGNVHSVPYTWGTVGILYNKTLVSTPPTSWAALWDEQYAGKIYMYDSMRDSIAVALLYLGYDINTRDEGQLAEAVEALKTQKAIVQSYGGDEMRDSMINGSGALCVTYSGDAVFSMMENEDLGYAVPDEGSNLWFDCMVIPKSSQHQEAAEAFINFLLDPEVATINTEYIGYSTPNTKALEMVDQWYIDNNAYNPADDVVERCTVYHDLGEFETKYAEAWQEVKWYTP